MLLTWFATAQECGRTVRRLQSMSQRLLAQFRLAGMAWHSYPSGPAAMHRAHTRKQSRPIDTLARLSIGKSLWPLRSIAAAFARIVGSASFIV
jgi:hypothetical protein